MPDKVEAPDTLTILVDSVDREIFMSFGLLNDLTTVVADPGRVATISMDPALRVSVLNTVLAIRKKNGKIEQAVDVTDIDISIKDAERLIDWVSEHVMSFFVRSLQKVLAIQQHKEGELKVLLSSLAGSNDSASATP